MQPLHAAAQVRHRVDVEDADRVFVVGIGALPMISGQAAIPPWAGDLDGTRKVVLVTQGDACPIVRNIANTLKASRRRQGLPAVP